MASAAGACVGPLEMALVVAAPNTQSWRCRQAILVDPRRAPPAIGEDDGGTHSNESRALPARRARLVSIEHSQQRARRCQLVEISDDPISAPSSRGKAGIRTEVVQASRRASNSEESTCAAQPTRHRNVDERAQRSIDE